MSDRESVSAKRDRLAYFAPGEWMKFRTCLLYILTEREAIGFSYLANLYLMRLDDKRQHVNGWVRFTTKEIQKGLPWNRRKVEKVLQDLVSKGMISTKTQGRPPRRWISMDDDQRLKDLMSRKGDITPNVPPGYIRSGGNVPKRGHCIYGKQGSIPPKLTVLSIVVPPRRITKALKEHCLTCRETEWKKVSKTLEDAISKVRTIPATAKRSTWHEHIKKVHTLDGVPADEVQGMVEWYAKTLVKEGDPSRTGSFLPEAFSGASFRKKWDPLVSARNRRGGGGSKPKIKVAESVEDMEDGQQGQGDNMDFF